MVGKRDTVGPIFNDIAAFDELVDGSCGKARTGEG
jgi:hypothetical protein